MPQEITGGLVFITLFPNRHFLSIANWYSPSKMVMGLFQHEPVNFASQGNLCYTFDIFYRKGEAREGSQTNPAMGFRLAHKWSVSVAGFQGDIASGVKERPKSGQL